MDVLIRNALVYDGSGGRPHRCDLAVGAGVILSMAESLPIRATEVIDAEGLAVAPGFIDMHSHSDEAFAVEPRADSKIRQGVTTEVIGNCGFSAAPLEGAILDEWRARLRDRFRAAVPWRSVGEYLFHLQSLGLGANCIALVGHGNLRRIAVGDTNRPASPDERALMAHLLAKALEDGAWGVSSGLIYVPSCFADTDELSELARVAQARGGLYASHIRGEGDTLEAAVEEAIAIGRAAGVTVEVSHHKASGVANWGKVERTLARMAQARAEGVRVFCDQYPYAASSTGLDAMLPTWVREGGRERMVERLLDFDQRARVRRALQDHPYGDWSRVQIARVRHRQGVNRALEGKNLAQAARVLGKSGEDVVMDLLVEEAGEVSAVYFSMCDDDVDRVMRDPHTAVGSDAAACQAEGRLAGGVPHPRAYGTFPRLLGRYARDKGVLSLEEAIHRMTGMPAKRLGLPDRGVIREEAWADLVIFDAERIHDTAAFTDPHRYPEGIEHVLVNGRFVVRDGQPTGDLPGRVLRRGVDGVVPYPR